MTTVIIADSQNLVRKGMAAILLSEPGCRVVGEAEDGMTALALVENLQPDVLALEVSLPRLHGLELIRTVSKRTKTKCVVVSSVDDSGVVCEALRGGAVGFIHKNDPVSCLPTALRTATRETPFVSPSLRKTVFKNVIGDKKAEDPFDALTAREREVLRMAAEGMTNSQIGQKLFISSRTVEGHRANLMKKLNLENQTSLVRYAIRRRVVTA